MALIGYAGQEHRPNPNEYDERCKRAYRRFKAGWTTLQIAKQMGCGEAKALRYVTLGRCMARGLEIPYG